MLQELFDITVLLNVVLEHPFLLYYTDDSCQLTGMLSLFYDYRNYR